jgi:hypothetical protein
MMGFADAKLKRLGWAVMMVGLRWPVGHVRGATAAGGTMSSRSITLSARARLEAARAVTSGNASVHHGLLAAIGSARGKQDQNHVTAESQNAARGSTPPGIREAGRGRGRV